MSSTSRVNDPNFHGWSEYTSSDGRRYYHNSKTGQSTWDKPEELKTPEERANFTPWKDYTTADGRTYYFNTETKQSVWTMPRELKKLRGLPTDSDEEEVVYGSKEEARAAFKILLDEKGITYRWKWDETVKVIQGDKRFRALETTGEKRQVFAEYIGQNKKKHMEMEREKKKNAREELQENLKQWPELKVVSKYKDFAEAFRHTEWWKWLDEKERDDIFQDFMDDYVRQTKEDNRKERRDRMDILIKYWEDDPNYNPSMRWREVKELMADNEHFSKLEKIDALQTWQDYVRKADNTEEQERARKVRFQSRKARAGWISFLEKKTEEGSLNLATTWKTFVEDNDIEELAAYRAMIDAEGSTPREVFEDYVLQLQEALQDDKNLVKKYLKNNNIQLSATTSFDEFVAYMVELPDFQKFSPDAKQAIYDSLVTRGERDEKRRKKGEDSDGISESSSERSISHRKKKKRKDGHRKRDKSEDYERSGDKDEKKRKKHKKHRKSRSLSELSKR